MKKLLVLLGIMAFIVAACGGASTKATGGFVPTGDIKKDIIGTWVADDLGEVLAGYKMTVPAGITFNEDGTYEFYMTISGTTGYMKGTYRLDPTKKPITLDFTQLQVKDKDGVYKDQIAGKSAKSESEGIVEIKSNGDLRTIFYRKNLFTLPDNLNGTDAQIYKKVVK